MGKTPHSFPWHHALPAAGRATTTASTAPARLSLTAGRSQVSPASVLRAAQRRWGRSQQGQPGGQHPSLRQELRPSQLPRALRSCPAPQEFRSRTCHGTAGGTEDTGLAGATAVVCLTWQSGESWAAHQRSALPASCGVRDAVLHPSALAAFQALCKCPRSCGHV